MTNYTLPPKPKKPQLIPVPLILVGGIVLIILLWQHFSNITGEKLVILHTNDLQGQVTPFKDETTKEDLGGFARIATIVQSTREAANNVILLNSGDTIQRTLFAKVCDSDQVGKLMSQFHYNAVNLGEHDFDEGRTGLIKYIKNSNFPFFAANIDASADKELQKLISPTDIITVNKIKVGIFGLLTPEATVLTRLGSVKILDPIETSRKAVKELQAKDADVILALTHLGLTADRELASKVSGIDIIVGGHSRTKLSIPVMVDNPDGRQTIIVQAKNLGKFVGKLVVGVKDKKVQMISYQLIPINANITPDPIFEAKIKKLEAELERETHKSIGKTLVDLDAMKSHVRTGETNVGNLFAKAVKEAVPDVDFALQNSGGIRSDNIFPKNKDITIADIFDWHPYGNKIVLITLTGKQIKEILERGVSSLPISKGTFLQVEGMSYTVDLTGTPQQLNEDSSAVKTPGDRVIDIKINGKPIDMNKSYRVAINDFMIDGGDGFVTLQQAKDIKYTSKHLTDAVEDYIRKHSPLDIKTDGRIVVKGGLLK